jgi:hypothetical protein
MCERVESRGRVVNAVRSVVQSLMMMIIQRFPATFHKRSGCGGGAIAAFDSHSMTRCWLVLNGSTWPAEVTSPAPTTVADRPFCCGKCNHDSKAAAGLDNCCGFLVVCTTPDMTTGAVSRAWLRG